MDKDVIACLVAIVGGAMWISVFLVFGIGYLFERFGKQKGWKR